MRGGGASARSGGASRQPTVKLKTARGRTASSQRWLERQLNDPYVVESKRLGYRSRAAFKLLQLDEKFELLKPGARVLDLGAAPGGWTQVAVAKVGAPARGRVVGLDVLPVEPIAGATVVLADFGDAEAPGLLRAELGGQVDVVLSDMAAPSTGHAKTDHIRVVMLCELALDFALEVLAPEGVFVAKVFQGGSEGELLARMKRAFRTVRHFKPAASRSESPETYVVATGFRGTVAEK
ncbi:MAG: RlmE family RNA methyltransferase [Alphaproteobacteria bacterium]|nr:RlmE family RNA methyltransferase [Alphaproteobacteria bacterium]